MEYRHPSSEPTLLHYWSVLLKRRLWIGGLVCGFVMFAYVQSKLSPSYYVSTAVILPSSSDAKGGLALSLGGDEGSKGGKEEGGGLASLMGQGATAADMLKSILNSRTMANAVIEQLDLKAYYGSESMEVVRGALKSETTIMVNREKAFFITVESTDPRMAAEIANAYVANLDRLHRMLNATSVTRNRMFIERRLEEKRQQLVKAEEARKQFQETNRTLLITDKARAAMTAAGSIEENILDLEVELAALKEYATPAHPMMNQVDAQIQALRKQLDRLQDKQQAQMDLSVRGGGVRTGHKEGGKEFYPPMPELANLALEYVRLSREVKIHEAIVGMLVGQYEQARIAEVRDTPTIQVLDPAIPAEFKSRPRTLHNMQVAALVALVMGCFLALLLDHVTRLRRLETGEGFALEPNGGSSSYASLANEVEFDARRQVGGGDGMAVPRVSPERESDPRPL